jgi:glycosyltransferase involved in cell wall biosynthesis
VMEVMPIGTRIGEVLAASRDVVFEPPAFAEPGAGDGAGPARPVRLAFLGYNHHNKGLPLLVEALEGLDAGRMGRIELSVFALGGESIEWKFRRMEPRLAKLVLVHGYQYQDIPWALGGKDLTLVCSTWWDPAPQVVLESFACGVPVLGAAVGGIPEMVRDGVDGILFRGNDTKDLAAKIAAVVDRPWELNRLRANVGPPKTMAAHARELEGLYGRLVGRGSEPVQEAEARSI